MILKLINKLTKISSLSNIFHVEGSFNMSQPQKKSTETSNNTNNVVLFPETSSDRNNQSPIKFYLTSTEHHPRYLRKKDVCTYCSIANNTLDKWINRGLPFTKIESTIRFDLVDVDEFMQSYKISHLG